MRGSRALRAVRMKRSHVTTMWCIELEWDPLTLISQQVLLEVILIHLG